VKVTVQYFDDCPSWRTAEERLRAALARIGEPETVILEAVDTEQKARERGFKGSPSILVDGIDPFDDPGLQVGLSCRLYRTPDGLQGAPTTDQLVGALEARRATS
jgi:hypothetical protein